MAILSQALGSVRYLLVWGLLTLPANTCSNPRTAVWARLWPWNLNAHFSASANRRSRVHRILGLSIGDCHFSAHIASDSGTVNVERQQ